MADHLENNILASLDANTFAALSTHLNTINLEFGDVIAATHEPIDRVYFPHSGIISSAVELIGGGAIEGGMISRDGQFGASQSLIQNVSTSHIMVQVKGTASVVSASRFRSLALHHPMLPLLTLRYEQFFLGQAQQTAACNAIHSVEQRTCRWLLRMQALVGNNLYLTQQFLAQMMGVRRTSVTEVATIMQKEGMIAYRRGHVQIKDITQIRERACDCHDRVQSHYAVLFDRHVNHAR